MNSEKKTVKRDLILIGALLLLALLSFILFSMGKNTGGWAVVSVEGSETARYSLAKKGVYSLNGGTNTLVIEDGCAWISEANCPDHTCMRMGKIRYEGQVIVCLPNRLVVSIEGVKGQADLFVN